MTQLSELERFLFVEYPRRLQHIESCRYLGIKPDENRYDLELERYKKEQEYRRLIGKKPLDNIKFKNLL